MIELIRELVLWVGAHPLLAGALVGLAACLESLAFVGMVVPGAAIMLSAGALVGSGALEFWSTLAWAVGGAVLGDGVSYWLGYRYRDRIRNWPPLARRPHWLERGERFFQRHGGKSILFARFVGPVRPVVPVVAGMLRMGPGRFYTYNTLSALAWAPAHLLPGMAFGASLAVAGQVAVRLALLFGAMIIAAWAIAGLIHVGYRYLEPLAWKWTNVAIAWGHRHKSVRWIVGDLFDPSRPVSRVLLVWVIVLFAGTWIFFGVLEDVLHLDPIVYTGRSVFELLQQLRTP
jgi:membrane protein DedA with SNARE-associated domain